MVLALKSPCVSQFFCALVYFPVHCYPCTLNALLIPRPPRVQSLGIVQGQAEMSVPLFLVLPAKVISWIVSSQQTRTISVLVTATLTLNKYLLNERIYSRSTLFLTFGTLWNNSLCNVTYFFYKSTRTFRARILSFVFVTFLSVEYLGLCRHHKVVSTKRNVFWILCFKKYYHYFWKLCYAILGYLLRTYLLIDIIF